MLYCLCQKASCQNAFQRQALMSFPSKQSITHKYLCGKCWMCCPFHFPWKFLRWHVVIWRSYCELKRVGKAASVSQGWISEGSPWFLISTSIFATKKKTPKKFCGLSLRIQTEPSEGDPVRFVRGPSDAMFLPGQSGRGTPRPSLGVKWAAAWSLDERSKGSPCRKLHRAGLYPPPGTDGTPSLVCPSASRSGAERSTSQKMSSVSSMNLFKFTMLLFF